MGRGGRPSRGGRGLRERPSSLEEGIRHPFLAPFPWPGPPPPGDWKRSAAGEEATAQVPAARASGPPLAASRPRPFPPRRLGRGSRETAPLNTHHSSSEQTCTPSARGGRSGPRGSRGGVSGAVLTLAASSVFLSGLSARTDTRSLALALPGLAGCLLSLALKPHSPEALC